MNPNSLVARGLQGNYYNNSTFFEVKLTNQVTFMWRRSIANAQVFYPRIEVESWRWEES